MHEIFQEIDSGEKIKKERGKLRMKACQNHHECIVAFDGDICPFCKMEKNFKAVGEEIQKSMGIMEALKMAAEEAGMKFD